MNPVKEQSSAKKATVRPGFLILGVLSIIMMVVWCWVLKPKPQTQTVNKQEFTLKDSKAKEPVFEPTMKDLSLNLKEIKTSRDPFLPPLSFYATSKNNEKTDLRSLKDDPIFNIDNTKAKLEELIKPVWKGMVGTANNKVVIIQYKNKTYLLKKGDQIPESKYRVSEIRTDSVIITFSDGKFSLLKK